MSDSYNDNDWPGKFEGAKNQKIAEYLNTLAMEGECQEQFGSVTEPPFSWYGVIVIDKPNTEAFLGEELQWAYIIHEDEHGFFDYEGFDDPTVCLDKYFDLEATVDVG